MAVVVAGIVVGFAIVAAAVGGIHRQIAAVVVVLEVVEIARIVLAVWLSVVVVAKRIVATGAGNCQQTVVLVAHLFAAGQIGIVPLGLYVVASWTVAGEENRTEFVAAAIVAVVGPGRHSTIGQCPHLVVAQTEFVVVVVHLNLKRDFKSRKKGPFPTCYQKQKQLRPTGEL